MRQFDEGRGYEARDTNQGTLPADKTKEIHRLPNRFRYALL